MIRNVKARTPYNYDVDKVSDETGLACPPGSSKARQEFKDETDINTIVRRFGLLGELPTGVRMPQYGDFDQVSDYQSALNIIMQADAAFMEFPANVRKRFDNDPQKFLEFVGDPANTDEAIKLGVALPRATMADPAPSSTGAPTAALPAGGGGAGGRGSAGPDPAQATS